MTKQRIFTITQKWRFRHLKKYSLTFDYISDFVVSFEQKPSQLIRPHAGVVRFWSRMKPEHTLRSTETHPASIIGKSGSSINNHHTRTCLERVQHRYSPRQHFAILVKRGSSRQVFPVSKQYQLTSFSTTFYFHPMILHIFNSTATSLIYRT